MFYYYLIQLICLKILEIFLKCITMKNNIFCDNSNKKDKCKRLCSFTFLHTKSFLVPYTYVAIELTDYIV